MSISVVRLKLYKSENEEVLWDSSQLFPTFKNDCVFLHFFVGPWFDNSLTQVHSKLAHSVESWCLPLPPPHADNHSLSDLCSVLQPDRARWNNGRWTVNVEQRYMNQALLFVTLLHSLTLPRVVSEPVKYCENLSSSLCTFCMKVQTNITYKVPVAYTNTEGLLGLIIW